jgi:hypothetical protein
MKANAAFSGPTAVRNPLFPTSDVLCPSGSEFVHPGLVSNAMLTPSVQVQILSVVDETGSASIGQIIDELPGHPDPVGAIFALINADVLTVLTGGIVDADTMVARSDQNPEGTTGAAKSDEGTQGAINAASSTVSETALDSPPLDSNTDCAGYLGTSLPEDLLLAPVSELKPKIIMGPGWRRASFRRVPALKRHGVYIMLRGQANAGRAPRDHRRHC